MPLETNQKSLSLAAGEAARPGSAARPLATTDPVWSYPPPRHKPPGSLSAKPRRTYEWHVEQPFQLVLLGQQDGRHTAIPLGDDPDLGARAQGVGRQEPVAVFEAQLVLGAVLLVQLSPITGLMAKKEEIGRLGSSPECLESAGGSHD